MSGDAQLWQDLLYSSGGDLELPKCSFHHIRFKFSPNGRPYMRQGRFSPNLFVTTSQVTKVRIKQLCTSKSHKLLGCHKALDGNQEDQKYVLKTKCNDYAKVIQSSCLARQESRVFFRHIYIPSVSYPLSTAHFTFNELDYTQQSANRAIFRHCGFWKGTPRPILYGPSEFGGEELDNLIDCQSHGQPQMLLKHCRVSGVPHSLTGISLSWWQWVAGTSTPILEDHQHLPHLDTESKWFTSVRQYLIRTGATVEVAQTHVPPLQRVKDAHIMDLVLAARATNGDPKFSPTDIRYINWVRLHLQVCTISDLAQANGARLDMALRDGTPDQHSSTSTWIPCHQQAPSRAYCWQLWCSACAIFSHKNGKLRQPLGEWLTSPEKLRRRWPAYCHPNTMTLYLPQPAYGYTVHQRCPGGHVKTPSTSVLHLLTDAVPTDYIPRPGYYKNCLTRSRRLPPPPPPPPPSSFPTFERYKSTFPQWEKDLMFGLSIHVDEATLLEHIQLGHFVVASDGSAPEKAAFGWLLVGPDPLGLSFRTLASCNGPVFGAQPASFRAEAHGLLSSLSIPATLPGFPFRHCQRRLFPLH